MSIIFKILKVICWAWNILFGVVGVIITFNAGFNPFGLLATAILIAIPVSFLVWRFKADKKTKALQPAKTELKEESKMDNSDDDAISELIDAEETSGIAATELKEEKITVEELDGIEQLKRYKTLLDIGIITPEEFYEKKKQLLNADNYSITREGMKIKKVNSMMAAYIVMFVFSFIVIFFFIKAITAFKLL